MPPDGTEQRQRRKKDTIFKCQGNVQSLSRKINDGIHELTELVDVAVIRETKKQGKGLESLGKFDYYYNGVP